MINQLFLIGQIKEMPEGEDSNKFILEVKRNYKNSEGVFEKDCFTCHLWIALSKRIMTKCKQGDLVALKGRLVDDNGKCNILAEQVILLNKVC